jgi:hypothetical protein
MTNPPLNVGFSIEVAEGDALDFAADVLIVKDWRASGGIDAKVRKRLMAAGYIPDLGLQRLNEGETFFAAGQNIVAAAEVLIVGPTERPLSNYTQVRELAADMLKMLKQSGSKGQHVVTTLQGVNTRHALDEREVFRAMLLGLSDAYERGDYPATLQRITFVERDAHRADLMKNALQEFLPPPVELERSVKQAATDLVAILAGQASFAPAFQRPEANEQTPHVFVAMPFADAYDDQFYLAIRPAIEAINHLCVRLDQNEVTFTGDIVEQIKERIRTATLVIALLDDANPNVYLEVGYAWGVGTPTLLLVNKAQGNDKLPFDVRGQKCLMYDKIHKLKDMLSVELRALLPTLKGN